VDPDASARALRTALRERHGLDVAVIVSDTMGRPWRTGLTDVALGAAGIQPLRDYRGELDAHGNELHLTQMAVIDELCAAAELVKGKYDQVPVAVVRGLGTVGQPDGPGARPLVRDLAQDLFPLGAAEARVAALREAADLPSSPGFAGVPVEPTLLRRVLHAVASPGLRLAEPGARDKLTEHLPGTAEVVLVRAAPGPAASARAGADAYRLRLALAADGLASAWLDVTPDRLAELAPPPTGQTLLGALAVGYPAG